MNGANWVYLNDAFKTEQDASLPVNDLGFLRGYGVFDFFRLVGGTPLFLDQHLRRFYASAAGLYLDVPYPPETLKEILHELIERNGIPSSGIRITLTGGPSPDGYLPGKPTLLLTQQRLSPAPPSPGGLRLITTPFQRQLPGIKTIDYLMGIRLQIEIRSAGADDVLYHKDGRVTECPRSNFFLVTAEGRLLTPATGVLPGITRQQVLLLARDLGAAETDITLEMLQNAREVFITSTSKAITPVASINDLTWNPATYQVTPLLQQRFKDLVDRQIITYKY